METSVRGSSQTAAAVGQIISRIAGTTCRMVGPIAGIGVETTVAVWPHRDLSWGCRQLAGERIADTFNAKERTIGVCSDFRERALLSAHALA